MRIILCSAVVFHPQLGEPSMGWQKMMYGAHLLGPVASLQERLPGFIKAS